MTKQEELEEWRTKCVVCYVKQGDNLIGWCCTNCYFNGAESPTWLQMPIPWADLGFEG